MERSRHLREEEGGAAVSKAPPCIKFPHVSGPLSCSSSSQTAVQVPHPRCRGAGGRRRLRLLPIRRGRSNSVPMPVLPAILIQARQVRSRLPAGGLLRCQEIYHASEIAPHSLVAWPCRDAGPIEVYSLPHSCRCTFKTHDSAEVSDIQLCPRVVLILAR